MGRWVSIPKSKGRSRRIYVPDSIEKIELREMLPRLHRLWKRAVAASERRHAIPKGSIQGCVHGFLPGRSPVTMAIHHVGAAAALALDIEDFFDHVTEASVLDTLTRLSISPPDWLGRLFRGGIAAQGLPTSPAVSNIACVRMDARFVGLARRHSLVYTRYADDIVLSSRDSSLRMIDLLPEAEQIIAGSGFRLHRRKVRVQTAAGGRITVCGVSVGDGIYPSRRAKRRLRALRHLGRDSAASGLEAWCRLTLPRLAALGVLMQGFPLDPRANLICHVRRSPCSDDCVGAWQAMEEARRAFDAYTALAVIETGVAIIHRSTIPQGNIPCLGRAILCAAEVARRISRSALLQIHRRSTTGTLQLGKLGVDLIISAIENLDPAALLAAVS